MYRKSENWFFPLIIVAVIVFAVGMFKGISLNYKEKHCTQTIRAEIVRVEMQRKAYGKTKRTVYTPYFTYSADGKIFSGHAEYTKRFSKYKVGDTIEIRIDPENPKKYLVENDISDYRSSYEVGKGFGLLALMLTVFAVIKKLT
ncbi:MAG: DUF3592 domain-containing protein [Ruminococcus sp.]|nr:DUF3592 domain-containing protein [Ruminococcus sp.]MDE6678906.1 DUF3592 domain-containing protein [Ruminococcus sp.]